MATWQDGPEYAPLERPAGFDVPDLPALESGPPPQHPSANAVRSPGTDAPGQRPNFEQQTPVPALEGIGPGSEPDRRDPRDAFEVVQSVMTTSWGAPEGEPGPADGPHPDAGSVSGPPAPWTPPAATGTNTGSAWAAVHGRPQPYESAPNPQWGPPTGPPSGGTTLEHLPPHPVAPGRSAPVPTGPAQQPPFPPPGSNQWFGPGVPTAPHPPPSRLGLGTFLNGVDPLVFSALVVGGIISVLSPLMFIVAMILSGRVRYRQAWVRNTFWLGAATVFTTLILSLAVSGGDFTTWYAIVATMSMITCLGVLAVISILVALALTNGEPPETGPPLPPPRQG